MSPYYTLSHRTLKGVSVVSLSYSAQTPKELLVYLGLDASIFDTNMELEKLMNKSFSIKQSYLHTRFLSSFSRLGCEVMLSRIRPRHG